MIAFLMRLNLLADRVKKLEAASNGIIEKSGGGGGGLDLENVAFGYEIDPDGDGSNAKVQIKAGEVYREEVAATDITLTETSYVFIKRNRDDGSCTIESDTSVPADDNSYDYFRLYKFTFADGAAELDEVYHIGDIDGWDLPKIPSTSTDYALLWLDGELQWIEVEEFSCPT